MQLFAFSVTGSGALTPGNKPLTGYDPIFVYSLNVNCPLPSDDWITRPSLPRTGLATAHRYAAVAMQPVFMLSPPVTFAYGSNGHDP